MSDQINKPTAKVLQLCFWEAMKRCGDDDRVHDMDYPYHDDPLIDGRLPGELWEHMEAALSELAEVFHPLAIGDMG